MAESRTLILMRHASAGHQGGTRDHDRPLTAGGQRDARAAGAWIAENLPAVDAVLCSTATRTRQTLTATGIDAPSRFLDELYGGGTYDILELLEHLPAAARTVLVIGHAPGIPATAAELATIGNEHAAAARDGSPAESPAEGDAERSGTAELRHFASGAFAVLTTSAEWSDLPAQGAALSSVHSPGG